RFGSRLALFALAVQMVLSFGHVHLPAFARVATAPQATADTRAALPQAAGPIRKPHGLAGIDCPVFALIQLASSSAPAAPPSPRRVAPCGPRAPPPLPLPFARGAAVLQLFAELPLTAAPQLLFRARAPPSV